MNEGIISSLCAAVTGVPVMKQTPLPWHMLQNALRAAQDPGTLPPRPARGAGLMEETVSDEVPPCPSLQPLGALSFQRALSGRADLEEQGGSVSAEVSRDRLYVRTLSRVLKVGQALSVRTERGADGCSAVPEAVAGWG